MALHQREHGFHGYLRINEMKGRLYHIDSGMLADVDAQASESIRLVELERL
jgi:hypothetical protein